MTSWLPLPTLPRPAAVMCVIALASCGAASTSSEPSDNSASATIGAPIAAETTAVSSSATGVEAARAGLARWLKENRPATPLTSTDIDRCPAIELTTLTKALITVGLTDELQDWGTEIEWNEYEALSPDLMGIVCGGDSDGEAHRSEIGTAAGVIAVDLATLTTFDKLVKDFEIELGQDGVTAAQCFEDSGATTCVEVRDLDGLVIGVTLGSSTSKVTADDARTLLDAALPSILETLAAN